LRSAQLAAHIKALFTLIAVYFLLLSGGAQAVGRYRMPIMPLLCILAAGTAAGRRLNSFERGFDDNINAEDH
jgi:4-amino-4-deoxy-L-arabinose transferase-like glycosyltransferase